MVKKSYDLDDINNDILFNSEHFPSDMTCAKGLPSSNNDYLITYIAKLEETRNLRRKSLKRLQCVLTA